MFGSLPNDIILDWSKLKALQTTKHILLKKLKFVLGREENLVEKGQNVVYPHFHPLPKCFHKISTLRS